MSCRYHLYLDVLPNGVVRRNFPDVDPDELDQLPATCALDVADAGRLTLLELGRHMGMPVENARRLQDTLLERLRGRLAVRRMREARPHDTEPQLLFAFREGIPLEERGRVR